MLRLAIVDDDSAYRLQIKEFIERYENEYNEKFSVKYFSCGMDFITDYRPLYDIVFLDIEMPLLDGMTVARKLREVDGDICIVFITNMRKYAIEGYEVNAVDFIVKPIKYYNFVDKLQKAIKFASAHKGKEVVIKNDDGIFCIAASKIYYIEKEKNYLIYHTERGDIRVRGTIEEAYDDIGGGSFVKCNRGCIVNMAQVDGITQNCVVINGTNLPLPRRKATEFKDVFLKYLRGKG